MAKKLTPTEEILRKMEREIDEAMAEFRPIRVMLRPDGTEVVVDDETYFSPRLSD